MALAIFPGSFSNPSCIAARELSKVLHEEAPILAPFSTTVDFNILGQFYFESYRCFPFFCPDVCYLWPASVPLSGILPYYRVNYCWKCSLDIKTIAFARKDSNTLSSRRRNAISRKTSMRWRNRIFTWIDLQFHLAIIWMSVCWYNFVNKILDYFFHFFLHSSFHAFSRSQGLYYVVCTCRFTCYFFFQVFHTLDKSYWRSIDLNIARCTSPTPRAINLAIN